MRWWKRPAAKDTAPAITLPGLLPAVGALSLVLPRVLAPPLSRFTRRGSAAGAGYFLYGPHFDLGAGDYDVLFWLDIAAGTASPRLVFDAVAWEQSEARTLADHVRALPAGEARIVVSVLRFGLAEAACVELRAWSDVPLQGARVLGVQIQRLAAELMAAGPLRRARAGGDTPSPEKRATFAALAHGGTPANRLLEIWLACDPTATGDAVIHLDSDFGESWEIELGAIASVAPFTLADGRRLAFLAFPSQASRDIFGQCRISARLAGEEIALGRFTVPTVATADPAAPSHRLRLSAAADKTGMTQDGKVRLRAWVLDDLGNPPFLAPWLPAGAEPPEGITLKDVEAEFGATQSGFLVFDTGPDCGSVICRWGGLNRTIELRTAAAGLRTVLVPGDLGFEPSRVLPGHGGSMAQEEPVEIFALGLGEEGTERSTVIEAVWRDYPLVEAGIETLKPRGDFECIADGLRLWRGSVGFGGSGLVAIQLRRHDRGGLCAIRHRGRTLALDLFAPRRESILVLPQMAEPVIAPDSPGPAPAGPVHPALSHLFRRMRPDWLAPAKTAGGA